MKADLRSSAGSTLSAAEERTRSKKQTGDPLQLLLDEHRKTIESLKLANELIARANEELRRMAEAVIASRKALTEASRKLQIDVPDLGPLSNGKESSRIYRISNHSTQNGE